MPDDLNAEVSVCVKHHVSANEDGVSLWWKVSYFCQTARGSRSSGTLVCDELEDAQRVASALMLGWRG